MKISNSKKQLAKIISENGGWRDGAESAAQSKSDNAISFYCDTAYRDGDRWWGSYIIGGDIAQILLLPNWHQTILSRDEYFYLYPVVEAAPETVVEAKPTIEQLVSDYRNAKNYADRKQQEADDAKADAEAKLAELVATGKAHGLVLSVVASGSELVITDWRDLQLGDIIEYVDGDIKDKIGMTGPVVEFAPDATDGMHVRLACDNGPNKGRLGWPRKFRFIRRP